MSLRPARAQIRKQSEPLVDVLDEEEEVVVVAELSGVEKEDISLYASKYGLESYKYAAEEIPRELLERTELFSTFECYYVFLEPSTADYTTLRFLSSKHGILFAESKYTRDELTKEGGTLQMKYGFLPFSKLYSVNRNFTSKGDLRLYHFSASDAEKEKIKMDCRVMKTLYDIMSEHKNPIQLGKEKITVLANAVELPKKTCLASLERILDLYQLDVPPSLRAYVPDNFFGIFSKRFEVDLGILRSL